MDNKMIERVMWYKLLLIERDINEDYKWIATDKDGGVYVYVTRPCSNFSKHMWCTIDMPDVLIGNSYVFLGVSENQAICWEESLMFIRDVIRYE